MLIVIPWYNSPSEILSNKKIIYINKKKQGNQNDILETNRKNNKGTTKKLMIYKKQIAK